MEERLSSRKIFDGEVINLRVDEVKLENGVVATREVVEHRGATAIVPILDNGDVILVRQYRYPVETELLEIPAGTSEPNEDPKNCAVRELEEETGYRCGKIVEMTTCFLAPGYSTEKIHIFLAKGLAKTQTHMDEDEKITTEIYPLNAALEKITTGEIRDAKSIVGLHLASRLT